jgi:hypothetical protein
MTQDHRSERVRRVAGTPRPPLRSRATIDAARAAALELATSEALYASVAMAAELADWAEVAEKGAYLIRVTDPTLEGPGRDRHVGPFTDSPTALAHAEAIRAELLDMLDGTDEDPWSVEVLPLFSPDTYAQPAAQPAAEQPQEAEEPAPR